ncbi:MAG: hypothetical protein JXR03_11860 [Cyclobacteriaceae bacterium]
MQRKLNDSFIDQYCNKFSEIVATDFFEKKSSITGKEILSVTPSKQVNFFILKSLFTSWQEEMKRLESPYFNFKDSDVRKALVSFMNLLSQKIEVKKDDFAPLVRNAVADTILLLTNPSDYLRITYEEFGSEIVSEKSVKTFLKYIKVYKSEFEQALEAHTGDDVEEMLDDAEGFFSSLDLDQITEFELSVLTEIESISMESLYAEEDEDDFGIEEDILEDKHEEIEENAITEAETVIDTEELQEELVEEPVVEELIPEEPEEEVALEEVEEPVSDEYETEEPEVEHLEEQEIDSASYEEEQPPEIVEDEKEDEISREEEIVEDELTPLNDRLSEPQPKSVNENFEQEDQVSLADKLQQTKIKTIMEAISVNNRYMFIKELFDGDKDHFNLAIENLETCDSFDDAVEVLVQDYAKSLDWDMNSDEVKELLKVVFRKFR